MWLRLIEQKHHETSYTNLWDMGFNQFLQSRTTRSPPWPTFCSSGSGGWPSAFSTVVRLEAWIDQSKKGSSGKPRPIRKKLFCMLDERDNNQRSEGKNWEKGWLIRHGTTNDTLVILSPVSPVETHPSRLLFHDLAKGSNIELLRLQKMSIGRKANVHEVRVMLCTLQLLLLCT